MESWLKFSVNTFAYLDPGTGSYLWQIIAAALFGILFTVKVFFAQIKTFFISLFKKDKNP